MASDGRSYVAGYFDLLLDGFACGFIQKFTGGDIVGEVVTLPLAHDYYVKKHIGNVSYNAFDVTCGLSMGGPLNSWIEASLAMGYLRKSGEFRAADFKREVRHVRVFSDALLSEITFPKCAGDSKEPAFMTLKMDPWTVRNKAGTGEKVDNPADVKQKLWLPCDFRLTIDGLEKSCAKVSAVEALTIKQSVVSDKVGAERDYFKEPGAITFPDLKFTVSEEFSHDLFAFHEDFVINGNNDDTKEKTGSLVYLDRTRQKELLTLTFSHLGIFKIASAPGENNQDKIKSVTCELYMENLQAKFAG